MIDGAFVGGECQRYFVTWQLSYPSYSARGTQVEGTSMPST